MFYNEKKVGIISVMMLALLFVGCANDLQSGENSSSKSNIVDTGNNTGDSGSLGDAGSVSPPPPIVPQPPPAEIPGVDTEAGNETLPLKWSSPAFAGIGYEYSASGHQFSVELGSTVYAYAKADGASYFNWIDISSGSTTPMEYHEYSMQFPSTVAGRRLLKVQACSAAHVCLDKYLYIVTVDSSNTDNTSGNGSGTNTGGGGGTDTGGGSGAGGDTGAGQADTRTLDDLTYPNPTILTAQTPWMGENQFPYGSVEIEIKVTMDMDTSRFEVVWEKNGLEIANSNGHDTLKVGSLGPSQWLDSSLPVTNTRNRLAISDSGNYSYKICQIGGGSCRDGKGLTVTVQLDKFANFVAGLYLYTYAEFDGESYDINPNGYNIETIDGRKSWYQQYEQKDKWINFHTERLRNLAYKTSNQTLREQTGWANSCSDFVKTFYMGAFDNADREGMRLFGAHVNGNTQIPTTKAGNKFNFFNHYVKYVLIPGMFFKFPGASAIDADGIIKQSAVFDVRESVYQMAIYPVNSNYFWTFTVPQLLSSDRTWEQWAKFGEVDKDEYIKVEPDNSRARYYALRDEIFPSINSTNFSTRSRLDLLLDRLILTPAFGGVCSQLGNIPKITGSHPAPNTEWSGFPSKYR